MYLQCPFQYFSAKTMRLRPPPGRPEERLDFLTQGNIVHSVLSKWYAVPGDIEPLFEEEFARALEQKCIQPGYHTERLRNAMLDDLRAFAADGRWPRQGLDSRMEEAFEFDLTESIRIAGKIDRLDIAPDGTVFVTDYKYSRARRPPRAGATTRTCCRRRSMPWRRSVSSACGRRGCTMWL